MTDSQAREFAKRLLEGVPVAEVASDIRANELGLEPRRELFFRISHLVRSESSNAAAVGLLSILASELGLDDAE